MKIMKLALLQSAFFGALFLFHELWEIYHVRSASPEICDLTAKDGFSIPWGNDECIINFDMALLFFAYGAFISLFITIPISILIKAYSRK